MIIRFNWAGLKFDKRQFGDSVGFTLMIDDGQVEEVVWWEIRGREWRFQGMGNVCMKL